MWRLKRFDELRAIDFVPGYVFENNFRYYGRAAEVSLLE
jgi:hypothetical protein